MKRLLGLIVLLGLAAAGLYYWRSRAEPPIRFDRVRLAGPVEAVKDSFGDAAVRVAVQTAFRLHRDLSPLELQVEVQDRVVTLRGQAPGNEARETAQRVAEQVPEVKRVRNEIAIAAPRPGATLGRSLGEAIDDEKLALQARLALSLNRRLQGRNIDVAVGRGVARLTGEVETLEQRDLARKTVAAVPGVSSVTSDVRVRGQHVPRP
jgi:osmotically-inducible protein OsmY